MLSNRYSDCLADFGEKWMLTHEQLSFKLRQAELENQACMEATNLIRRLADKANRKANEAQQRLNAFCKRHGIENVDEYIKVSKG